jgi:hypothetical protein
MAEVNWLQELDIDFLRLMNLYPPAVAPPMVNWEL